MAVDYANSNVQGYNPTPGPKNPVKYPFVGPAYNHYGEQAGYIYDPYSDSYKPDPKAQQSYYEQSGLSEPKKDPSLIDQLAPVAGAGIAYGVGQGLAKDPSGFIGGIRSGASSLYNSAADTVSGAYNYASNAASTAGNSAASTYNSASDSLSSGAQTVSDYFSGTPSATSTAASSAQNTGMISSASTPVANTAATTAGDYGATQAALGLDYGTAAANGTTTFATTAAAEQAGYQVIGQNADGTVMAVAGEGSSYLGTAGNVLGTAASVYALYNIGVAEDKDDFGSAAQGAVAGAYLGSNFGPWGTAIGAVLGAAYGFAVSFQDKDTWKKEKKRLENLSKDGVYIPENLTAAMPKHGRKLEDLVVKDLPADFVGFANIGGQSQWVNNKFQSDRKVENLVAEDIVNYGTFAEDDPEWFKRSLQERLNIANAALQAGAVKEHHGTIEVDFKKFDKTKAGQYNAVQGNPTALEIAGQLSQAPNAAAAPAANVPNPQAAASAPVMPKDPAAVQTPGTPRPNPGPVSAPSNTGMIGAAPKDNNVAPQAAQPRAGYGVRQSPGIYVDPRSGKTFKSNTGMLSR